MHVLRTAAGAAALAMVAAGCGGGSGDEPLEGRVAAMTSTVAAAPSKPMATVAGSVEGTSLELLAVRRSGRVLTAQLVLRTGSGSFDPELLSEDGERADLSGARLVDDVNVKEYAPLRGEQGGCVCTSPVGDGSRIGWDQEVALSAKFPAPPDGVREVSLTVPTFASFEGIVLG